MTVKFIVMLAMIPVMLVALLLASFYYYFLGGKQRVEKQDAAKLAEIDEMLKKMRNE